MPSLSDCFQALIRALSAYRWRPFDTLTLADISALLED
jgi:hypothetical protein